jgi:hypothetical protein
MYWTKDIETNIIERCTFHCEHYGTNIEDKVGEVCAYYFLLQRFNKVVNPPYVLKEDNSNFSENVPEIPYIVGDKDETVQVITNGIERSHKGIWTLIGSVDLENNSYSLTDFTK